MTTDDLIARLAGDLKPVSPGAVIGRVVLGLGLGLAASSILMLAWLGMRPDLMAATGTMPFWSKLAYTLALAAIGASAVKRIAHPLGSIWPNLVLMLAGLLLLGVLAGMQLAMAPPERYPELLIGKSMAVCTFNIVMLSLPFLIGAFWVLRGLAPTRLTVAGGAAGLAAGAMGALVYSFHCTESGMPFVAVWYTLGVLVPGLIGAAAGRFVLRW
ncbi:MAG: NrsF family protein [Phyllobacterium sp.]